MIVDGAVGDHGVPVPQHLDRARAGGGHRLHVLHRQRAGLRDVRLHRRCSSKDVRDATKDVPEIDTRFSVVGFGGDQHRLRRLRPVAVGRAHAQPGADPAGCAEQDQRRRRRAGLRLRPADAARHRRRPAGAIRHPLHRRRRPGLRGGRGDQEPRAGERPLHRGAEFAVLHPAAGARHRRPRPRGGARRADQRDRHDADGAGRRRLGIEIRPRKPQLRRHHPGGAGQALQPGEPRRLLREKRDRRHGAAFGRDLGRRRGRRRSPSSSSTSSTPPPSPACRGPGSPPATRCRRCATSVRR